MFQEQDMEFDVTTIGSATVDYFADTDSELIRIETRTTREELLAFPMGEKILVNEFNISSGGGGTNTAVAFARLGFRTAYLGKIGSDLNGDFIIEQLGREGIRFVGAREGQSGASVILNGLRNDRTILAFKGINNFMQPSDFPAIESPWVYLASMLGQSWDTVVTALCEGLQQGRFKLALNPSSYQAALGYDALKVLTDQASLLIMNREEACKYLGLDPDQRQATTDLCKGLAKVPGLTTVVTDGGAGAWVWNGSEGLVGLPRPDLKVAETTGAGDAFAATFTACTIKGLALRDCLHYAMTNAESILQHKGAKNNLLDWAALESTAQQHAREISGYN
jgi:ribokinase